jgi:DEAD/DEAH box helicase
MFDRVTSDRIDRARGTTSLPQGAASRELALAYVKLASIRLRSAFTQSQGMRIVGTSSEEHALHDESEEEEQLADDELPEEGSEAKHEDSSSDIFKRNEVRAQLSKIADAYEIIALCASGEEQKSAAFVSATAHLILAREADFVGNFESPISTTSIHPAISASLLFLVAEQHADAAEAAKLFDASGESPDSAHLLTGAIFELARGNLEASKRLAGTSGTSARQEAISTPDYRLDRIAFLKVVETTALAVSHLCDAFQGDSPTDGYLERALQLLNLVTEVSAMGAPLHEAGGQIVGTLSGTAHLARLLAACAPQLSNSALITVDCPPSSDGDLWRRWIKSRLRTHPFLWPNHLAFTRRRAHFPGSSCVLVLPTGAGKTTVSSLKIAAAITSGKSVVFLAPTHALVEQLIYDLGSLFPSNLFHAEISDGSLDPAEGESRPRIDVMTPEAFLAAISYNAERFSDCGLIVFDECHLLSALSDGQRRSIDGMLCVIGANKIAPEADFLMLSAMLTDGSSLADWLQELTGRECVFLDLLWKPSRQARGVVVYDPDEIEKSKENALLRWQEAGRRMGRPLKSLGKAAEGSLTATPHALWGLSHNWLSRNQAEQTTLQALLDSPVQLKAELVGRRHLRMKPNVNAVATALAMSTAGRGMKTIIFVNNRSHTFKVAREINASIASGNQFGVGEEALLAQIVEELGALGHSYLTPGSGAVPHNASMLRMERDLAERMFQRADGAAVIVATPTLAQGLNLPAHVAILAGDKRAVAGRRQDLLSHEVLNAAARAGRAGHLSNGIVLLIPEPLVTVEAGSALPTEAREKLEKLLPEDDRCVDLVDPLGLILDALTVSSADNDTLYFVNRMSAMEIAADGESPIDLFDMRRSFAAWNARRANRESYFDESMEVLKDVLRHALSQEVDASLAVYASKSGLPIALFASLRQRLLEKSLSEPTVSGWLDWLTDWLSEDVTASVHFMKRDEDTASDADEDDVPKLQDKLSSLRPALHAWIDGLSLVEIDALIPSTGVRRPANWHLLPRARDLAVRVVGRDLSYAASVVAMVAKDLPPFQSDFNRELLEKLPVAIRKGFNSVAMVGYANTHRHIMSRVAVHREYQASRQDYWPTLSDE